MARAATCACGVCDRCKSRAYTAASRARAAAATQPTPAPTTCKKHPDRQAIPGRRQCNECRSRALGRVPRVPRAVVPAPITPPERSCIDCGAACGGHRRCDGCYSLRATPRETAGPCTSVTWNHDLTLLRRALPAGAAVAIGQRGVVIDLIGERHRFASVLDAIDWATTPRAS
jgi:hypothetical protein